MNQHRKLRMGMIGGGRGSFIGGTHRMAAQLDGQIELVCGAFSRDGQRSVRSGEDCYLPESRCYASYEEMIREEAQLPEGERMDFVSIVTPNHVHCQPALMALSHKFPVIIDKPLAFNIDEAYLLKNEIKSSKLPFAITYTYSGYPMVKQARAMVQHGELGSLRKIVVEYPQGWLSKSVEEDSKQAAWRTNKRKSGISNCFADIGTHAAHLIEYVAGVPITHVLAQLNTYVPGRELDDDAQILLRLDHGVTGIITASQIMSGEENSLRIKVYGEDIGLEWCHSEPNTLKVKPHGLPMRHYHTGSNHTYLHDAPQMHTRLPGGHPEGFIEAFANIYRNFAFAVWDYFNDSDCRNKLMDFPTINDGVKGMELIKAVVESSEKGNVWVQIWE